MGTALMSNDSASCPYGIGDGFWTKNPTNPSERWAGTTWAQIKDVFLLSCGDSHSLDEVGGEESHKLTIDEMPSHRHNAVSTDGNPRDVNLFPFRMDSVNTNLVDTNVILPAGGDRPHNNMPPYLTRYYWERTG